MTLVIPVILSGCYQDFTPDVDTNPVLAINSLITAGEPITVQISHTWVYDKGFAGSVDTSVDDAIVSVYANDDKVEDDYIPNEGDRIRIVAISDTYGTAEAEVMVPYIVTDADVEYTLSLISDRHSNEFGEMDSEIKFNVNVALTFKDNQQTIDYYKFSYSKFCDGCGGSIVPDDEINYHGADFYPGKFDENSDPIFSEHMGIFESVMGDDFFGFTLFTDRQFSGNSYTLRLRYTEAAFIVQNPDYDEDLLNCGYIFHLESVSPSFYNWANYEWQVRDGFAAEMGDLGLADPMWGYSNVSTGAGVVAARSVRSITVNLKDFIKNVIAKEKKLARNNQIL